MYQKIIATCDKRVAIRHKETLPGSLGCRRVPRKDKLGRVQTSLKKVWFSPWIREVCGFGQARSGLELLGKHWVTLWSAARGRAVGVVHLWRAGGRSAHEICRFSQRTGYGGPSGYRWECEGCTGWQGPADYIGHMRLLSFGPLHKVCTFQPNPADSDGS